MHFDPEEEYEYRYKEEFEEEQEFPQVRNKHRSSAEYREEIQPLLLRLDELDRKMNSDLEHRGGLLSKIFGESVRGHRKRQRTVRERMKIFSLQRANTINTFAVPRNIDSLLQLAQLSIACYRGSLTKEEKQAWKTKLEQTVKMVEMHVFTSTEDVSSNMEMKLAYIREQLNAIEQEEKREKRYLMFEFVFSAFAIMFGAALAEETDGVSIAMALFLVTVYWAVIRRKFLK